MATREQRYGAVAGDGPDPVPSSDVQRNLWLRHSIFRRLTDDPVLYLDALSIEERSYLASPTGRQLLHRAAEQGGFVLENRTEGMLLIDTECIATDSRFPDDASTAKVAALLLLDGMDGPCTTGQLQVAATALLAKFPRWARSYREDDGPAQLVSDALAVLQGFGLVSATGGLVRPLPAALAVAKPEPRTPRWMPTRAGIHNVWRYYDEVFIFHDGRLLLRGPNGSGKSKALELLLPFLLDASLRASRLSTFGTAERSMHWNLMGEGASGTTRVGYVWLEFGLPAADVGSGGAPGRWFCCGARLQASTHTTTVHADYFTTTERICTSDGVALVNEAGQPLTKAALEERLGEGGVVYGNAGDYRAAIRAALFPGLTEQRYDALITALLQLRTPKLSQRLDPALLSTLLSRALPPLGHQEIADLAEGFERLDRQRERLVHLAAEVEVTRVLADRQRTYARRVLRSASAALISATSVMDTLTRTARTSAEEFERVDAQRTASQQAVGDLRAEIANCDAQIDGMTESEAYKHGRELDGLRRRVAEERARSVKLLADAGHKRSQADADKSEAENAQLGCGQREETVRVLESYTRHAAGQGRPGLGT